MSSRATTYPLRLPESIKKAAERLAERDGASLNQFIAVAVAQKVSAMETAAFYEERRGRADLEAFDRFMAREGGEPPRPGDELP